MDPNIWGPHGWQFLHSITLAYPEIPSVEDKNNHAIFFNNLKNILPCKKCKDHFANNLLELPIENYLDSKETLFNWLVDIHNRVNITNNKRTYSYDEVETLYENQYTKKNKISNIYIYIALFLLLLFLCIYYVSNY